MSRARDQVVAETEEPFLPLPDDLIVNLQESRAVIEALLDALPAMFASNLTVPPLAPSPPPTGGCLARLLRHSVHPTFLGICEVFAALCGPMRPVVSKHLEEVSNDVSNS